MIDIKVAGEDKPMSVPNSWSDISLKKYLGMLDIKDDDNEEFKSLILISYFTDIPLVTLKRMPLGELQAISSCMQFLQTPIPEKTIENFTIDGNTFHVMQSFLLGQAQDYIAVEAILSDYEHDSLKALPKLLAVVCKKEGVGGSVPVFDAEQNHISPRDVCVFLSLNDHTSR